MRKRVAIAGGSGLIGRALVELLRSQGHEVTLLVRREAANDSELPWNPESGECSPLDGFDAVINLAGESIGKLPWTKRQKAAILNSRISATNTLVNAINRAKERPSLLVSASGSGFYGNRGAETLDESSPRGTGFLAEVTVAWEAAANRANCRVAIIRTGIVFSASGGALGKLLPLIKLGVGGPLGSGEQWWPWISLADEVAAIAHLISLPDAAGPYNLVAPEQSDCSTVVRELGRALKRPAWLRAPAFALRIVLGEAADELLLGSQRIRPQRLLESGYLFSHGDLRSACEALAAGSRRSGD